LRRRRARHRRPHHRTPHRAPPARPALAPTRAPHRRARCRHAPGPGAPHAGEDWTSRSYSVTRSPSLHPPTPVERGEPVKEWMRPRGHEIALLFSRRSRDAYVALARGTGETYTFTDAWDRPRTWIKGEHAYLAPNAASVLLARCNLKHDVVEEADLTADRLAGYRALLVPNAAYLSEATIEGIERWLDGDRRLLVTGKTNLPPRVIGVTSFPPFPSTVSTACPRLPGSPYAPDGWAPLSVRGGAGLPAPGGGPARGSRVLAEMVEIAGDLTNAHTATTTPRGPAIVLTERTAYVANQVLELIGGMLQAHLNVEAVRHWANPTHWGDTLLFSLRRLLLEIGLGPLWQTRLRSFGA